MSGTSEQKAGNEDHPLLEEYESSGDNEGYDYQAQFLVYFCLMLRKMKCEKFAAGYEVKSIPKFDDVVCELSFGGQDILAMIQCKFVLNTKRKLNYDSLFPPLTVKKIRGLRKKFSLKQYIGEIKEVMEKFGKNLKKFIIITNLQLDPNKLDMIPEHNKGITKLLGGLGEDIEVHRFGPDSYKYFEPILTAMKAENIKKLADYIMENLIIVTNTPDTEGIRQVNTEILTEEFQVTNKKSLLNFVSENILEFCKPNEIEDSSATGQTISFRKRLTNEHLDSLLNESILENDLEAIASAFLEEIPFNVEFEKNILVDLSNVLSSKTAVFVEGEENLKLNALKVVRAIAKTDPKVLLIPFSKLSKLLRDALKSYKKRLVILVDEKCMSSDLLENEHLIFVAKITENLTQTSSSLILKPFSFTDLTENTFKGFLNQKITIQGVQNHVKDILENSNDVNCQDLFEKIFVMLFNNKKVEIGNNLPENRIPKPYIEREFFLEIHNNPYIKERDLFEKYDKCLIKGQPGMGKSTTMQKLAKDFKLKRPHYWIMIFELNLFTEIFDEKEESSFTDFMEKEDSMKFILDNLALYKKDSLDRELVEYYLSHKNPPIFFIFDGFDEIMPFYEKIAGHVIEKLFKLNIKIFVTGRMHSENFIRQLARFDEVTIRGYDSKQWREFLSQYLIDKNPPSKFLDDTTLFIMNLYEKNDLAIFQLVATPLFIKMLIENIFKEFRRSPQKADELFEKYNNITLLSLYDTFFELSFDKFREKEGVEVTRILAKASKKREMKLVRKIHAFLAVEELNLKDYISFNGNKEFMDDVEDIEILARGFVARTQNKRFSFLHRTFAEYFVTEVLLTEIEKGNQKLLHYISNDKSENTNYLFVHQMLLSKIESGTFTQCRLKDLYDHKHLLNFSNYLIANCSKNFIQDLPKVLELIRAILSSDDKEYLQPEELFLKLLPHLNQFRVDHLRVLLQDHERVGGKELGIQFLKLCNLIFLREKIEHGDVSFLEEFYQQFKRYGVSEREILQEIFTKMKICYEYLEIEGHPKVFNWYFGKIFQLNLNDPLTELHNQYLQICQDGNFCGYFVFYLQVFEEKEKNSDEFLQKCYSSITSNQDIYNFVSYLDRFDDRKVVRDFIDTFWKNGYDFVMPDCNSILYHCWIKKQKNTFRDFLDILSKEDIFKLTASPYFEGQSLLELHHSKKNGDFLVDSYLEFVYRHCGEDEILKFLSIYHNNEDISQLIHNDMTICCQLSSFAKNNTDFLAKVVQIFCNNVLQWEAKTGIKSHFLHQVTKITSRNQSKIVFQNICEHLINENILAEKSNERDSDGNSFIHICAIERNPRVFQVLNELLEADDILSLMELRNDKGMNFFHFIGRSCVEKHEFFSAVYKFSINPKYQTKLSQLLQIKDQCGKPWDLRTYKFANAYEFKSSEQIDGFTCQTLLVLINDVTDIFYSDLNCGNARIPLTADSDKLLGDNEFEPLDIEVLKRAFCKRFFLQGEFPLKRSLLQYSLPKNILKEFEYGIKIPTSTRECSGYYYIKRKLSKVDNASEGNRRILTWDELKNDVKK